MRSGKRIDELTAELRTKLGSRIGQCATTVTRSSSPVILGNKETYFNIEKLDSIIFEVRNINRDLVPGGPSILTSRAITQCF